MNLGNAWLTRLNWYFTAFLRAFNHCYYDFVNLKEVDTVGTTPKIDSQTVFHRTHINISQNTSTPRTQISSLGITQLEAAA